MDMNNRYSFLIVLAVTALITGCTSPSETGSVKTEREPESIVIENTIEKPAVKAEDSSEEENTNPVTAKANNKDGLYDTSYLEEDEGGFTYRLSDQSIKDKYDDLYSAAFVDLIDSYNRVTGIDNQSFPVCLAS